MPAARKRSRSPCMACAAVEGGYRPFAIDIDAPDGASAEAAAAAAAYTVLAHYLPDLDLGILRPAYEASLAGIPSGQAKDDGVATGTRVAQLWIARRANDRFRAQITYTPPNPPIPGVWLPTAPPLTPAAGTDVAVMRPFTFDSADDYRPAGPPALTSKQWTRDYNEVKELGSSTSTSRTPEQTEAARFWAEAPVQQSHNAYRQFVLGRGLDIVDASRLMAMVFVTFADAEIACFEAKYYYAFWRPVTAIRAGDTDGNDDTIGDPSWTPLIGTPNHPEYPSAHSCITPAGARVVARFLGTGRIDFTVPSLTGLEARRFDTVGDLEEDVGNARIWGGIHFRSAVEDGLKIAAQVAHHVLAHNFQESND